VDRLGLKSILCGDASGDFGANKSWWTAVLRVDFQPAVAAIDDAHFHARLDIADRLGGFTRRGIDSAGAGNFVGACDS
jgi:hypothetical protein